MVDLDFNEYKVIKLSVHDLNTNFDITINPYNLFFPMMHNTGGIGIYTQWEQIRGFIKLFKKYCYGDNELAFNEFKEWVETEIVLQEQNKSYHKDKSLIKKYDNRIKLLTKALKEMEKSGK